MKLHGNYATVLACIAKLMLKHTRFSHMQLLLLVMQQKRLDDCTDACMYHVYTHMHANNKVRHCAHSVIMQTTKRTPRLLSCLVNYHYTCKCYDSELLLLF